MLSDTEQITTIKTQTLARIAGILAQPPLTYDMDGECIDWEDYLKPLKQTVAWCNQKLVSDDPPGALYELRKTENGSYWGYIFTYEHAYIVLKDSVVVRREYRPDGSRPDWYLNDWYDGPISQSAVQTPTHSGLSAQDNELLRAFSELRLRV